MNKKKLVVIGGGAAGFFCAVTAAAFNPKLEVILLEKSGKLLSKVKVSGGGRCNVTHACFSINEMIKNYPRGGNFLKKAFHHFFTTDTTAWFQQRGVTLKTEPDGRMFPVTDSSQTIIDCLMNEANKHNVQIRMNADVKLLKSDNDKMSIVLTNGETVISDFVCVACGGLSKASQFDWLKSTGHTIEVPVPSLFTFNVPEDPIKELMGVTVKNIQVKIAGIKFSQQGSMLITHWGFSGPAILKLSAFAARELAEMNYIFSILINWLAEYNVHSLYEKFKSIRVEYASLKIINRNPFFLPQRLWQHLLQQSGVKENLRWADLPAKQQNILIKNLCTGEFKIKGKTTFKEEFVTAGGIKLNEIDSSNMQSKIIPNLFFAGEIMNVDGITGGFNFQHAWTSGWIAGKSIAQLEI